jgi:hypothetical protein
LAASVAPSRREAQQVIRLAREEADRIVGERWSIIVRLADALAQRGHLDSDHIVRIVLQPKAPRARPRRAASRPARTSRKSQPGASWMAVMLRRCGAALGAVATRSRARSTTARSHSSARASPEGQASSAAMPVLTASEH